MTSPQHAPATAQQPIGSGYTARSSADDVLRGIDLSGTVAVVTGGYSGLGLETTRALSRAGATVVVPARRPDAAAAALADLERVEVEALDLADLASVRAFAARFLTSGRPLGIVIAGAGVMACPETRVGPGWESQFAINHLGHFAMVNLLWPAIAAGGGRVVVVASGAADATAGMRWHDIEFRDGYDKWQAYVQSKTANVLFASHLDSLGRGAGVRAFSVSPGSILTPLQRHLSREEMVAAGWVDADGNLLDGTFKTPAQGAATQVWVATSPQLTGLGGVHCEDCDIAQPSPRVTDVSGLDQAAQLWSLSATLTGQDAFSA